MVDEYNSVDLSAEESANMYKVFTEAEQFKNSTLLLALQHQNWQGRSFLHCRQKAKKLTRKAYVWETERNPERVRTEDSNCNKHFCLNYTKISQ